MVFLESKTLIYDPYSRNLNIQDIGRMYGVSIDNWFTDQYGRRMAKYFKLKLTGKKSLDELQLHYILDKLGLYAYNSSQNKFIKFL